MHENDLRDREWPIRPTDTELTKSAWRSAKKRADLVCLSALLLRDAGARQVSLVKKIGGGGRKFSRARVTGLEFHFVRFYIVGADDVTTEFLSSTLQFLWK